MSELFLCIKWILGLKKSLRKQAILHALPLGAVLFLENGKELRSFL
jgi:hypothetical protein